MRPITGEIVGFCRRNRGTAFRVAGFGLVVLAFSAGQTLFPLKPAAVLAAATGLGMLVAFELLVREAPQAWVLGSMLLIDAIACGSYLLWRQVQPSAPSGPLIAAADPSPPQECQEKPQAGDLVM